MIPILFIDETHVSVFTDLPVSCYMEFMYLFY